MNNSTLDSIRANYERRETTNGLYDPLRPINMLMNLERVRVQGALLWKWLDGGDLAKKDVLEIGCGAGTNILNLISLGAAPDRIVANDLIDTRLEMAMSRLPGAVRFHLGDGSRLPDKLGRFDLVMQFVVFSSILDDVLLVSLAERMWSVLRPGGAILSYDFAVNNPSNLDVRGISIRKMKTLFPHGDFTVKRLTVAPPIARRVGPRIYPFLATFPMLNTHRFCLIRKS